MANGILLIVLVAACWLALAAYLLGALLRRADATRGIGESVHSLAFWMYVFGFAFTVMTVVTSGGDIANAAKLFATLNGFPLLVCSVQFYRGRVVRPKAY